MQARSQPWACAPPEHMTTFPHWPPMAIAEDLWAEGGIGPARLAVMARAKGAKCAILGRANDRAAGVAFVALHQRVAMLHGLEVTPSQRRQGSAHNILRAAVQWAQDNGAEQFSLVVTRGEFRRACALCFSWSGACGTVSLSSEMSPKRPEQVAPSQTLFARAALAVLVLAATPLHAAPELALSFPAPAQTTYQRSEDLASFSLAKGPFEAGDVPSLRVEGAVHQIAWRIAMPKPSTMELLQSLRAQIEAAGFAPLFQCETQDCGGFDFRFASAVLPEPAMHVDLGDFRYLAAKRQGAAGAEYLALMISRSPDAGFVQMTQVGGARALVMTPAPEASEVPEPVLAAPVEAAAPAPGWRCCPKGCGAAVGGGSAAGAGGSGLPLGLGHFGG